MTLHVELVVHGSLKQIVEIVVFDTIQRVGIIISLTNIIASHAIPYQIMALGTTGIIASTATGIQVDAQPLYQVFNRQVALTNKGFIKCFRLSALLHHLDGVELQVAVIGVHIVVHVVGWVVHQLSGTRAIQVIQNSTCTRRRRVVFLRLVLHVHTHGNVLIQFGIHLGMQVHTGIIVFTILQHTILKEVVARNQVVDIL